MATYEITYEIIVNMEHLCIKKPCREILARSHSLGKFTYGLTTTNIRNKFEIYDIISFGIYLWIEDGLPTVSLLFPYGLSMDINCT